MTTNFFNYDLYILPHCPFFPNASSLIFTFCYIYIYIYIYIYEYSRKWKYIHTQVCACTHTHTHIYIYICVCVCVCVCARAHLRMNISLRPIEIQLQTYIASLLVLLKVVYCATQVLTCKWYLVCDGDTKNISKNARKIEECKQSDMKRKLKGKELWIEN